MKRIQFLSLLCLLIVLPIGVAMADMNVTWVRTGAVLETEHKQNVDLKINVATVSNGAAHALAETPTSPTTRREQRSSSIRMATEPKLPVWRRR